MPNTKQFVYNENCYFPVKIDSRSDSDDDFHTDCRNVSHHYSQQSFSGLHSPTHPDDCITLSHVTPGFNHLLCNLLNYFFLEFQDLTFYDKLLYFYIFHTTLPLLTTNSVIRAQRMLVLQVSTKVLYQKYNFEN